MHCFFTFLNFLRLERSLSQCSVAWPNKYSWKCQPFLSPDYFYMWTTRQPVRMEVARLNMSRQSSKCLKMAAFFELLGLQAYNCLWIFTDMSHCNSLSLNKLCQLFYSQVNSMDENERQKIREMSTKDLKIEERRTLYNALGRRMANPVGLSPGLVEKYVACAGCNTKRFELLKEFMLDADMSLACYLCCSNFLIHMMFNPSALDVQPKSTGCPMHATKASVSGKGSKSKHTSCSSNLRFHEVCNLFRFPNSSVK